MSLIQLPPGMTPEQYWATPEGKQAAEWQRKFAADTKQKQQRYAAPTREPKQQLAAPESQPQQPIWNSKPPVQMPGQAQSAQDPYASSTKPKGVNDIAREIEGALAEMAPDLGDAERRLMAADLAREYRQQRGEVVRGMTRPAQPAAPEAGRERKWDGNKYEYTDTPEYQARAAARQAGQQLQEAEQAKRRERQQIQMLKNSRGMALQAERDKRREAGVSGPLMREDLQDRIQRQNMAAQFKAYTSGQSKVPPPGMAQPIAQQGQGSAYGAPDKQAMYWQLVDGGMEPAQASDQVNRAFSYAPR